MLLTEKETTVIEDLRTQEQSCILKYGKYSKEAKDPVLKDLFSKIQKEEQKHYDTLGVILKGTVPLADVNDRDGQAYDPTPTYSKSSDTTDKKSDCFLATDCIGTEKLVSGEYNSDVFVFGDPKVRKALADIQVEEQNHAEMLWKYKTVNGMS